MKGPSKMTQSIIKDNRITTTDISKGYGGAGLCLRNAATAVIRETLFVSNVANNKPETKYIVTGQMNLGLQQYQLSIQILQP